MLSRRKKVVTSHLYKVRTPSLIQLANSPFFKSDDVTLDEEVDSKTVEAYNRDKMLIANLIVNGYRYNDNGIMTVPSTYRYGNGLNFGRIYSTDGIQMISGWIRRILTAGLYYDIDIVNCSPSLLLQWNERHGIESPLLRRLVNERDCVFSVIVNETGLELPKDRDQIKQMVLTCFFLGNYTEKYTVHSKWLDAFMVECRTTADAMYADPSVSDLVALVKKMPDKKIPKATLRSWVIQKIESKIITAASVEISKTHAIGMNALDGLLVEKVADVEAPDLDHLSAHCERETGWKCKFAYKDADPTSDDMLALQSGSQEHSCIPPEFRDKVVYYNPENHPSGHVKQINFKDNVRVYVVSSGMGSGKSCAISGLERGDLKIDGFLQRHPECKRMLYISVRQQQAYSIEDTMAIHALMNYLQGDPSIPLYEYLRLINQHESLHRIVLPDGTLPDYDLIIVDEIRGECQQITSPTNGFNLIGNSQIVEVFLKNYRCILMGADVLSDGLVLDTLREHVKPEEIHIEHYSHQLLPRTICFVDKSTWTKRVIEHAVAGKKLMLPFRSKSEMHAVKVVIEEACKTHGISLNIVAISSDSPKEDMAMFKNINTAVLTIDIFMFTSKCTVGADIQVFFDKVFIHADAAGGPTPLQMYQMLGRARNVRDCVVEVCIGSSNGPKTATFNQVIRNIQSGRDRSGKLLNHLSHLSAIRNRKMVLGDDGKFRWSADWLVRCAAYNEYEQQKNFTVEFVRYAAMKKFKLAVFDGELDDENTNKQVVGVKAEIKENDEVRLAASTSSFRNDLVESEDSTLFISHCYRDLSNRVKQNEVLTPPERDRLRISNLFRRFDPHLMDGTEVTDADVIWSVVHSDVVKRSMLLCEVFEHGFDSDSERDWILCHDGSKLQKSQMPELTRHDAAACVSFSKIIKKLGVSDLFAGTSFGSPSAQNMVDIKTELLDIMKDEKRRVDRLKTPSNEKLSQWVMQKIKIELERRGFRLNSTQQRTETGRIRQYTIRPNDHMKAIYAVYNKRNRGMKVDDVCTQSVEREVCPNPHVEEKIEENINNAKRQRIN